MKSVLFTISLALTVSTGIAQSVAINKDGSLPHTSAALDIKSNTKGLLTPRLTTAERIAVAAPAKGLLVFDTDTNSFWFYNGTVWTNLAPGGGNGFALPYAGNAAGATPVFSITNNGKGAAIYGRNDAGKAAEFINFNKENKDSNLINVVTYSSGNIPDDRYGNAASFKVDNMNSVAAAVRAEVNTIFGNFGAAAVFGVSSGIGGKAGLFYASHPNGNGTALIALTDGNGNAISANAGKNGNGVETNIDGSGNALYAWVPTFATGQAGKFNNFNESNTSDVISATTVGKGIAGNFKVDNTQATSAALKGEVNSMFANFGTAGVYGLSSGTGGVGGLFYSSNANGTGPAVVALAQGNGDAIKAYAQKNGFAVEATADGTGAAIYGWVPNYGQGKAARFVNNNTSNTSAVMTLETSSNGSLAVFKAGHPTRVNVARINSAGRGFFNGGTQNSGADLAEAFDVTGDINTYAPGDVLVISTSKDRAVEKSTGPYSTLVAGVYATKPGVLLTEEHIDSDLSDKVPMGVVGVIPTRVCLEGGAIKRGDLLVTSSLPGVAMKGDIHKILPGQVIGKALQDFSADTTGKINVLVNVK